MALTSPHNDQLKEIRKLLARRRAREQAGRFVAEGEDLLAAADAAGWAALTRLVVTGSGLPGIEVEASLLAAVSELGSGTRAIGVYPARWAPSLLGPLAVVLHGVGDPGNVGTVLRSAAAFGASSVGLAGASADPFGPKAVRASMGAVFEVPLVRVADAATAGADGIPTVALVAEGGEPLDAVDLSAGATLIVGAERDGLPPEVIAAADQAARIPIANHSLNAAMAATVALYETSRRMARLP